jgi:hypothetical protein
MPHLLLDIVQDPAGIGDCTVASALCPNAAVMPSFGRCRSCPAGRLLSPREGSPGVVKTPDDGEPTRADLQDEISQLHVQHAIDRELVAHLEEPAETLR